MLLLVEVEVLMEKHPHQRCFPVTTGGVNDK